MNTPGPDFRSRLVTILKVGLPLVALAMLSALFFIQSDDRLEGGALVFTKGDMDALGSGLRVTNPTLTGTSQRNDRFRFTADLVVPDAAPPTRADMTRIAGEIELSDGPTVTLGAPAAALDIKQQHISLTGPVQIDTSDGYEMRTAAMTVDLNRGILEAKDSVESEGPLGRITSGSLRIESGAPAKPGAAGTGSAPARTNTHLIFFGNGVRVLYDPPDNPN